MLDLNLVVAVKHCLVGGVPHGSIVACVIDCNDTARTGKGCEEFLIEIVVANESKILCDPTFVLAVFLVAIVVALLGAVTRVGDENDWILGFVCVGPRLERVELVQDVARVGWTVNLGKVG